MPQTKPTNSPSATSTLWVHISGERPTIRMRDPNGETARSFRGFQWFPIDDSYRVTGRFIKDPAPREVRAPNQLGDDRRHAERRRGGVQLNGQTVRLRPMTTRPKRFWFIFRDGTSGKETYETARFLYSDLRDDGTTVLDFNQAYNPPCAFNPFTTCPIPLPENRLKVRIPVGEKAYARKMIIRERCGSLSRPSRRRGRTGGRRAPAALRTGTRTRRASGGRSRGARRAPFGGVAQRQTSRPPDGRGVLARLQRARDVFSDARPATRRPAEWIRDRLRGETRDILIAGHYPHLPRLLTLMTASRRRASFPQHGVVALKTDDEGKTWKRNLEDLSRALASRIPVRTLKVERPSAAPGREAPGPPRIPAESRTRPPAHRRQHC